jgi:dienelactone hydrolase
MITAGWQKMIELLVAVAVASQSPDMGQRADSQTTSFAVSAETAAENIVVLDSNFLLDPSLPFVFLPNAPTAAPAASAGATTGPEDDLELLAAREADSANQAPQWQSRPKAATSFGAGANLRNVAVNIARANTRLKVGQRQMTLEIYRPDTAGARPAVLLLHGASGMGNGAFYRGAAEAFAEAGYVVYLPHYLGDRNRNRPRGRALIAEFEQQHDAVRATLDAMAKDPRVDEARLAAFGFSLGGFQALGLSSRDARVAAVVNMGGGMPGNVAGTTTRLAPTLVIHGQRDRTVPVARALQTRDMLKRLSVPHEMALFADQQHFFQGAASRTAIERSIAFFDRQMRPAVSIGTADLLQGR